MKNPMIKSLAVALCLSAVACVPTKKFTELEEANNRIKDENKSLHTVMEENDYLQQNLLVAERNLRTAYKELEMLKISNSRLSKDFDDLYNRFELLVNDNNSLAEASAFEKMEMEKTLNDLELNNQLFEYKSKGSMQGANWEVERTIMEEDIMEKDARLEMMQERIDYYEQVLIEMEGTLNLTFPNAEENNMNITKKDNKVYLTISQELLFKKGSAKLDKEGKETIKKFAQEFKGKENIEFVVEGHADSDGSSAKNWELSTKRAIAVVELMINSGMDPKTIIASGRSSYMPLAPNDTEANKAKNRRTEIILIPKPKEIK